MKAPIRLGLIGCGGIIQQQHLPTLLTLAEVQITALTDPMPENLATVGKTTGVTAEQHYADYRDMLAKERPEIVAVCPRHADQRVAMVKAACLEGKSHERYGAVEKNWGCVSFYNPVASALRVFR